MKILDVDPISPDADIATARKILAAEIANPNKVLLIIRGDSPGVGKFAEKARHATDGTGFRETIWVRDLAIFLHGQQEAWFGDQANCAVVLDFADQPVGCLRPDATLFRIDQLLRHAITPEGGVE